MVMLTTPSVSTVTAYAALTWVLLTGGICLIVHITTKSKKTQNQPPCQTENSNIGLHKVLPKSSFLLPLLTEFNTKINTQHHPDYIFLSEIHKFRVPSSLPFWGMDGK